MPLETGLCILASGTLEVKDWFPKVGADGSENPRELTQLVSWTSLTHLSPAQDMLHPHPAQEHSQARASSSTSICATEQSPESLLGSAESLLTPTMLGSGQEPPLPPRRAEHPAQLHSPPWQLRAPPSHD